MNQVLAVVLFLLIQNPVPFHLPPASLQTSVNLLWVRRLSKELTVYTHTPTEVLAKNLKKDVWNREKRQKG